MRIFLVWNNEDYYQRDIVAAYTTREAAEARLQAIDEQKPAFPSSHLLSVEDRTGHSVEELEVSDRLPS